MSSALDTTLLEGGEGSRGEILDAAAEAFMRKGYAAASIDDVSDILGCTKGRIYHHYRSKADLFFDVHRRGMQMDLQAVRSCMVEGRAPLDQLFEMAVAHLEVVMSQIAYQRVAVQGLEMHLAGQTTPEQRKTLRAILMLRDEYEGLFAAEIARATEQGALPEQDVRLVVKAFMGALNWTTIWYRQRRNQSQAERRRIAESIARFAVRGLGGRP
ncbi:MAG: TetR/AcrR family transcriptional regulator [Tistlia sp.]|uniref:TetR/AcrR family transcriptional regulator n=1 Tax=Tistlia sp. TaxID=3057121 RepID=UPI0034A2043F